ncbi:MAG: hypothetical protein KIT69_21195, partial [Propionibacteriaceae bacterium]|nr:hypothetical protein [Propionibacteriaceae bacterium]
MDKLSLDDEIAWGIARQRLLEGRSLIDTVYVRAVTATLVNGKLVPAGAASANYVVEMPPFFEGGHPVIDNPTLTISPGRVLPEVNYAPATDRYGNQPTRSRDTCLQVVRYPEKDVYKTYSKEHVSQYQGPDGKIWGWPAGPERGYPRIPNSGLSDYHLAVQAWPSDKVIYCQDWDAEHKREQSAIQAHRDARKCGVGCVLAMVVYGAAEGFIVGGPYGALVGAFTGLGLGVLSAVDPDFYALLKQAWDAIADVYNAVFTGVWKVVAALNPICQQIGLISDKAKATCDTAIYSVGSAAVTYYTGLPPSLPDSKQALAAAQGDLSGLIQLALDELLKGVGLSCSTFAMSESTVTLIESGMSSQGNDTSDL